MKLAPAEMSRPVKYADLTFAAAFALAEPPGEGVKVREEDPEKAGEALVRQLGLVGLRRRRSSFNACASNQSDPDWWRG